MIKHILWFSASKIPSYFLELAVCTAVFIYQNIHTEGVSQVGTNLAYSAKCSYHFSAIAKKNLCYKIKTVNETVNMIKVKTLFFRSLLLSSKKKPYVISKVLLASALYISVRKCLSKNIPFFFFGRICCYTYLCSILVIAELQIPDP